MRFPFLTLVVCVYSQVPELEHHRYGLNENEQQNFVGILNSNIASGSIREAKDFLNKTYCGNVSIEFMYIESEYEREWLAKNYEKLISERNVSTSMKNEILELLVKSQTWEHFVAKKFPMIKRYGGEGAESMMAFFHQLCLLASKDDISHIVWALPHRGRLNLLTSIFKTPAAKIFHKFKGFSELPSDAIAMGDVASHFRKQNKNIF